MTAMTLAGGWTEWTRPMPEGIGELPEGRLGADDNDQFYWYKPVGMGGRVFARPMVGASVGDAVEITGKQADDACTCNTGPTSDGFVSKVPPADVLNLLSPGYGPGYTTRYAQYKQGVEAEIWRLSYPEDFAWCDAGCVDTTKIPIGPTSACPAPKVFDETQGKCVCPEGTQDDGKGGCVAVQGGGAGGGAAGLPTWAWWVGGALGLAALGGIGYAVFAKPSSKEVKDMAYEAGEEAKHLHKEAARIREEEAAEKRRRRKMKRAREARQLAA